MTEIFAAFLNLLVPLGAAGALGGSALALGALLRRGVGEPRRSDPRLARLGVDFAAGLALLIGLGFWLGIAGRLDLMGLVVGILGLSALLGGLAIRGGILDALRRPAELRHRATQRPGVFQPPTWPRWALCLAGANVLLLVVLALYPPNSFDATMYHLPFAKAFVATGGLPYLEDLRFPVFPQGSEVLFAEAMLLGGDRAAQLMSLLATLAAAAILFGWVYRVAPGRSGAHAGGLAAALFLGGPVIAYLAGTAYCEPMLVLFAVATFDQLDRGTRDRTDDRWRGFLVGMFAGTAAGIKYFGLFPVGLVVAAAVLGRGARAERVRRLAWGLGGALAFALPWYVRNAVYTGNPVIPLFPRLFGPSPWGGPGELAPWSQGHGIAQLAQMALLPWTTTFGRPEFGRMPPWSPILWIALGVALFASRRDRRIRRLLAVALAYLLAFFFLPLDGRYLLSILPLLVGAAALGMVGPLSKVPSAVPVKGPKIWAAAALLALAPTTAWSLYQIHRLGRLPVSPVERDHFLAARYPAYSALRFLEQTRGRHASIYAFYAENHVYYAPGRFQGDWDGTAPFRELLRYVADGDALAEELRRRGVTHLLVLSGNPPPLPSGESFARRFRLVYDDGKAKVWEVR